MRSRHNIWLNIDWITVIIYLILILMGWFNIYSAVYNEDHSSIFDLSMRYGKQMIWILASILLAIMVVLIDSKFFISFSYAFYGLSIALLLGVLLFGTEVNGAKAWFQIGSFAFQPAELTKMTCALALARYMSSYSYKPGFKAVVIIGAIIATPLLLILLQNDTGSALVFFVFILMFYREGLSWIFLFIIFVCTVVFIMALLLPPLYTISIITITCILFFSAINSEWKAMLLLSILYFTIFSLLWIGSNIFEFNVEPSMIVVIAAIIFILICAIVAITKRVKNVFWIFVIYIGLVALTFSVDYVFTKVLEPHQRARIEVLLGMRSDPLGAGYNVNQSKIAIGSGGFAGKGFLKGTQTKFDFVPEQSTDFIFCTVGEEWGFIGTLVVILLFLFLFLRLLYLSELQRSVYSRIYGYCVASILFFHFAINVAMVIGLAPVIGIPLPFFSYGGSSLWAFTVLLFIFVKLDASRSEKLSR